MRLSVLIAAIMLMASCSHNGVNNESSILTGKWKLIASAISSGGAATWQSADLFNPSFVEFTVAGKIIFSDKNSQHSFDYSNVEEKKFTVTGNNMSVIYWYTIKGNELTLDGGGCIEQCTRKYRRI